MFVAQVGSTKFAFAPALDSLICVSRQVEWRHVVTVLHFRIYRQTRSPKIQQLSRPLLLLHPMILHRHTKQDAPNAVGLDSTTTHVLTIASRYDYTLKSFQETQGPLISFSACLSNVTTLSKVLFHISPMVLVHYRPQINVALE